MMAPAGMELRSKRKRARERELFWFVPDTSEVPPRFPSGLFWKREVSATATSEAEIAWATEVLAGAEKGGARRLAGGEMVDAAMTGRALRILRDAD